MSIEIIDKLKPKNNRGFKLMDAIDVEMLNGNSVEKEFETAYKKLSDLNKLKLDSSSLDPYATKNYVQNEVNIIGSNISKLNNSFSSLRTDVDGMLSGVAFDNVNLSNYYNKSYVDTLELSLKKLIDAKIASVDINGDISNFLSDYYTKIEIDRKLSNLSLDNYYDKVEINNKFSDYYNKTYINSNYVTKSTYELNKSAVDKSIGDIKDDIQALDNAIKKISNSNTELSGYYTKTQVDEKLDTKASKNSVDNLTTTVSELRTRVEGMNYVDGSLYAIDKQTMSNQLMQLDSSISSINNTMKNVVKREELNSNIEDLQNQINNIPGATDITGLTKKITTLESNVSQNTSNIALKANRNEVYTMDAINTKFNDVNVSIATIQTDLEDKSIEIASKVNKDAYKTETDNINNRLNTLSLELDGVVSAVDNKVNKTTFDSEIKNLKGLIDAIDGVEDNTELINRIIVLENNVINTNNALDFKVSNDTYEADQQLQGEKFDEIDNTFNQLRTDISSKLAISDIDGEVIVTQINNSDDQKIEYKNLDLTSKITLTDMSTEVKLLLDEIKSLRERIEVLESR